MRYDTKLIQGRLVKRYKRFFADVLLDNGTPVIAHCPNTGSMRGLAEPGMRVCLSTHDNPKRKLKYTWELVRVGRSWAGVNTARPNAIVAEAIRMGRITELTGYPSLRREVKYGVNSRVDILLEGPKGLCYVEVKNTTLAENRVAYFPDSVTERGQKHLKELMAMVSEGHRAVIFFLVHRSDCTEFRPADTIDPTYGALLREAVENGVEALPYACRVGPTTVSITRKLPLVLD